MCVYTSFGKTLHIRQCQTRWPPTARLPFPQRVSIQVVWGGPMQKKYLKKEKKTGTTRIGKKKKYIYTSQVLVSIYAVHMYIDMAEFVWVITATQSGEIERGGGGLPY